MLTQRVFAQTGGAAQAIKKVSAAPGSPRFSYWCVEAGEGNSALEGAEAEQDHI